MPCYFCEAESVGQCKIDGRFTCAQHGTIVDNKFVCIECELGPVNIRFEKVKELLERSTRGICAICRVNVISHETARRIGNDRLYTSLTTAYSNGQLNREDWEQLLIHSDSITLCPNGCILCWNHTPTKTMFGAQKCPSCGKRFRL
jgi:hypothetical protein